MTTTGIGLADLLGVLNLLGVIGLWLYIASSSGRIGRIDRRVSVLEERVSGMPSITAQLGTLSMDVAAIRERSRSTAEMVRSIQTHLMEDSP